MDPLALRFSAEALRHQPELLRSAMRVLRTRERAEDVLQDALLVAWRKYPAFQAGTNCRAWLFRILRLCLHKHRRQRPEAPLADAYPAPPAPLELDLGRALARLPASFRAVVELADLEELNYREVAARLQIPMGTVMSRLHRARIQLRSELTIRRPAACRRLAGGAAVLPPAA